jgi:hypothetical protein
MESGRRETAMAKAHPVVSYAEVRASEQAECGIEVVKGAIDKKGARKKQKSRGHHSTAGSKCGMGEVWSFLVPQPAPSTKLLLV